MSPDVPANWSNWSNCSNSSNLLMASVQCLPFPFLTFLTFHAEAAGFGRIGRIRLSTSAFKLTAGHGTRHHASSAGYGRSVTQRHAPYQGPSKQGTVATSGGSFAYLKIFYIYIYCKVSTCQSADDHQVMCYKSVFFVSKCVTEKERERELQICAYMPRRHNFSSKGLQDFSKTRFYTGAGPTSTS